MRNTTAGGLEGDTTATSSWDAQGTTEVTTDSEGCHASGYCNRVASAGAAPGEPRVFPGTVCKLEQLTGERDAPRGVFTRSRTRSRAGLVGTDLGSSFEHDGRLYFLFGDSVGGATHADALAWTDATTPDEVELSFHTDDAGRFLRLEAPGVSSGPYEVPSHGVSLDDEMYVVFTTDHTPRRKMGRSVLARSRDDGRTFERLFDVSTTRFINVALERARRRDHAELPARDAVLVWGSGDYRASNVRFAYAPAARFDEREAWRYFAGTEGGAPLWTDDETRSVDLFDDPVVGELSVAWIAPLERWVMLYNRDDPPSVVMRTAERPWGPWSDAQVVFDPWVDGGYAHFLHVAWKHARMDEFHDPRQQDKWGGPYGPYLIPRFTTGDAERCTLVFTLSTWNPYQVVLMSVDVGQPGAPPEMTETTFLPGVAPFASHGDEARRFERDGRAYVTTFGEGGDADRSVHHCAFDATTDATLSFTLHGGRARVVLVRDDEPPPAEIADIPAFERALLRGRYGPVLESIAGPGNNDVEVATRWNLTRHAGERVRLFVVDASAEAWGFVSLSEVTLRAPAADDR